MKKTSYSDKKTTAGERKSGQVTETNRAPKTSAIAHPRGAYLPGGFNMSRGAILRSLHRGGAIGLRRTLKGYACLCKSDPRVKKISYAL